MDQSTTNRMLSLNGSNWMIWKEKMEDILYCKDFICRLKADEAKSKDMPEDEWRKLNWKTIGQIR